MSRKTREQKKLAEYRRRLKLASQTPPSQNEITFETAPIAKKIDAKIQRKNAPEEVANQIYFKKDLKKSFLFIFFIITLEIVIYFARMNRYF